jgi:hypothetical protein
MMFLAAPGALPLWPGRERFIKRHRPPSGAVGPELPDDANRAAPEPLPHGCQPRDVAAAAEEDELWADSPLPSWAAPSGPGVKAPAELRANDGAPPPAPNRLSALPDVPMAAVDCGAPHSRHSVPGVQVCQRMVAAAADATASATMVNTTRLRYITLRTSGDALLQRTCQDPSSSFQA